MSSALSSCTALIPRALRAAGLRTLVALLGLSLASPLFAADRAGEFLEGLRARGWHDVALDYLASADEDPLATPEFLDRVDYERAVTLSAIAKATIRESERLDLTGQAIALLQSYAASHRDEALYFEAMSKAGNLLSEQALAKLAKARRLPAGANGERAALRSEARASFNSASKVVEQLLDACEEKLASLPKGALARQDADAPITRQQLTVKQAETRFLGANLLFEKANTYDAPTSEFTKTLEAAAEAFSELHKDYSDKLVGFYGRLYEGRCYQMAGKLDEALECYADLVDQPISNADFRRLVARAYRRRAECHVAAENVENAIKECRDWLNDARGAEFKQPQWLAVAYRLAEACQQKAEQASASEASRLQAEARQLLREVSREPGEFQADARTALASGKADTRAPQNVTGFDEAVAAGKQALERMSSSKLAARLAAENNPDAVAELKQQAQHYQAEAGHLFHTALSLADDDSKLDDVLEVRYFLCWIYWEDGLLHKAAVMGQFLAQRYPESSYAVGAAKVALAAYEKLYFEAKKAGEDGTYEAAQLASLAELVATLWPESSEARTAVNLLIQIALGDDRLQEAEQLLQRLPESNRASSQLRLGGAMWIRYLNLTAGKSGEISPTTARLKERAEQLLSGGYDALSTTAAPSAQVATGVLYYEQLLLAQGEFDRAVEVLENRSVGPLLVVENGRVQAAFAIEAYKAGLRAYISIVPPQRDKAQDMMTALEEAIGPNDDSQQLTRIYLSLGRQLQRQVAELTTAGKTVQAQNVAAFEDLLQRIISRGDSRDWTVRIWIAQANLQLGEGLRGEAAQRYLEQAEKTYREILAEVEKDSRYAPSKRAILSVRKNLGDCLLARQKFDEAFQQYADILRENPNTFEVQRTVALMLQQWGHDQQQSNKLEEAIRGALPQANRKNLVWGWLRLATIADQAKQRAAAGSGDNQPNQQKIQRYHNHFFEARYHVAKTRLLAAQIASGAERTKQLNSACKNVESMKRLYPDLGGPKWQRAFDELLTQIEAESST